MTLTERQTKKAEKKLAELFDGQTWETTVMYDDSGKAISGEVEPVAVHCLFDGAMMVDCLVEWEGTSITAEDRTYSEEICGAGTWIVVRR